MKSKKLALLFPVILVILLVWVAVLYSSQNNASVEKLHEQTSLVEKADKYVEDEVFARAIQLYSQASKIENEHTFDVTYKLAQAYKSHGDVKSYITILSNRCADENNKALESEFVALAEYYFSVKTYDLAMNTIDRGCQLYESSELLSLKKEHEYDFYDASGFYDEMRFAVSTFIPVRIDDKWGFINNAGGKASDFIYDDAYPFLKAYKYDGDILLEDYQLCSMVLKDNAYQIIDSNFERYSLNREPLSGVNGLLKNGYGAVKKRNGKYSFVDSEFRIISDEYEYIGQCSDNITIYSENGKLGGLNSKFTQLIQPQYVGFALNSYGEAFNCKRFFALNGSLYQMYDYSCNAIGSEQYEDAHAFYSGGEYAAVKKNGKWGFIDSDGKVVVDFKYDNAKSFSNGVAAVEEHGMWGYINSDGEIVIDCQFMDATPFSKYRTAAVLTENGYKLIAFYWVKE